MPSQRLLPGTAIREWRYRHDLSQAAAAKACGVHRVTWSQWERDRVAAPHWLAWAMSCIDFATPDQSVTTRTSLEDWRLASPPLVSAYILRDMEEVGGDVEWQPSINLAEAT